jgi:hypothetical protein
MIRVLARLRPSINKHLPNRHLIQQIVFQFELLHLPVPHFLILALEICFNLMPRSNVLASQGDFDLTPDKSRNAHKVVSLGTTVSPHSYEEMGGQRVGTLEVEEERLKRRRSGILVWEDV